MTKQPSVNLQDRAANVEIFPRAVIACAAKGRAPKMLFIETRRAAYATDDATRLTILERLQEKGLVPVVRSARLHAFETALAGPELTTIVSKVQAVGPKSFHMDLPLLENRFQFWRQCRAPAARATVDKQR